MLNSNSRDNSHCCGEQADSFHMHVFLGSGARQYKNTDDACTSLKLLMTVWIRNTALKIEQLEEKVTT